MQNPPHPPFGHPLPPWGGGTGWGGSVHGEPPRVMIWHRDHWPAAACSAVFRDCGFGGLSSPPFHRATGKSPEPAGWKTCATFRFMESFNLQHWTRIGAKNTPQSLDVSVNAARSDY